MTWKSLRPHLRAYIVAVILLGSIPLKVALSARLLKADGALVVVMLLAGAAASQKLALLGRPREGCRRTDQMSTMSLGFPVVLGSLLHYGVEQGILVAFISALSASIYPRRHPFHQAAFTAANLGLAALASGLAMCALAGGHAAPMPREVVSGPPSTGVLLLALLAGTLIYYAINTSMVAVAVALSQGKSPVGVWRDHFLWTGPGFVAGGAVVGMATALATHFGSAVASLSLLCLYLVHQSYSAYLQRMHQLEDNQQALRHAHDQLETRVRERTAELARSNQDLQVEIAQRKRVEEARQHLLRRLVTAQEEERQRIARELHDQMGQYLTALMLGLQSLKETGECPSPAQERVGRLQELTDQLMQEAHRLARELRPAALDDLGLPTALRRYAEGWSRYSEVSVDFHSRELGTDRPPPPVETTIYRVVQEALTNVLRHAQAQRVSVLLEQGHDQALAIVEDDGVGFDAETVLTAPDAQGRLGLLGMQERVGLVGGTLDIESARGAGTTVFVRIPLVAEEQYPACNRVRRKPS
jgi:signal transduction histidine kinase